MHDFGHCRGKKVFCFCPMLNLIFILFFKFLLSITGFFHLMRQWKGSILKLIWHDLLLCLTELKFVASNKKSLHFYGNR